jgi:hypothetical protein
VIRFSKRWVALTVGAVVGLMLGLAYTWLISPVELINTHPALLRADFRSDWVHIAALSYAADGDLERARKRLEVLEREDVAGAIEALINEYATAGHPADTMRRLTTLAQAFDVHTSAMLPYLQTPESPSPTPTSAPLPAPVPSSPFTPTATHLPTATQELALTPTPTPYVIASPLPTPAAPLTDALGTPVATPTPPLVTRLQVTQQEQVCEPGQAPHIEVVVRDESGADVAGVEIWLMWTGGADRAVTGLKPQKGGGYADFLAEPDVRYALGAGELGMPLATDLRIEPCPAREGEEPVMGSWRVVLEPQSLEDAG